MRIGPWYIQGDVRSGPYLVLLASLAGQQRAAVPTWGFVASQKSLEGAMGIGAEFLPEFDLEMAAARRTLERIPEDKLAWKPHEKSMLLGRLAGHIAELPGMGVRVMKDDGWDFAKRPAGEIAPKPTVAESQKHVLEEVDKNVAAGTAAT